MYDPNRDLYPTPHRYYQNGFDVTWYVMTQQPLPLNERFFEVTCK